MASHSAQTETNTPSSVPPKSVVALYRGLRAEFESVVERGSFEQLYIDRINPLPSIIENGDRENGDTLINFEGHPRLMVYALLVALKKSEELRTLAKAEFETHALKPRVSETLPDGTKIYKSFKPDFEAVYAGIDAVIEAEEERVAAALSIKAAGRKRANDQYTGDDDRPPFAPHIAA